MNWTELFKSIGMVIALIGSIFLMIFILFGVPILAAEIHSYLGVFSIWFIWGIFGSFLWPFKKNYLSPKDYLVRFATGLLFSAVIVGIFIVTFKVMFLWPETSQYAMIGVAIVAAIVSIIGVTIEIYKDRTK